jgi:hypothetical protein
LKWLFCLYQQKFPYLKEFINQKLLFIAHNKSLDFSTKLLFYKLNFETKNISKKIEKEASFFVVILIAT